MKIRYKIIEHERIEDSPFIGALISAIDCKFDCKNCFNQSIKNLKTKEEDVVEIIKDVKSNPFNKGIILGGLEWTLQQDEAISLARLAKQNELETMIYTGREFEDSKVQEIINTGYFDYIKCGRFKEELMSDAHYEYGVKLATENQHIFRQGIDF